MLAFAFWLRYMPAWRSSVHPAEARHKVAPLQHTTHRLVKSAEEYTDYLADTLTGLREGVAANLDSVSKVAIDSRVAVVEALLAVWFGLFEIFHSLVHQITSEGTYEQSFNIMDHVRMNIFIDLVSTEVFCQFM